METPILVIAGTEKTGRVLAEMARLINFEVVTVDRDFSQVREHGEKFVVIASGGRHEDEAIIEALKAGAKYVALVANRRRADEVFARLAARGIDTRRVRTKPGLEIHARGPEEIALSILAEIVAEKNRSDGGFLNPDRADV